MSVKSIRILLMAGIGLYGCGPLQVSPKWETGFWFWNGSAASAGTELGPVDVIFAQAGSVKDFGTLPRAREYWLVFRVEDRRVPALQRVPQLVQTVSELCARAARSGVPIAGIQLDVDTPTLELPQYAAFLREVRKSLPRVLAISITCLLDWFRLGTGIGEVLEQVDEFVPQFYDVQSSHSGSAVIATSVDGERWGRIFNGYRKRFRIGISTFGRVRLVRGGQVLKTIADLKPLDVAVQPAFSLRTDKTDAKELVLHYRATQKARIGYAEFAEGDELQFFLSTPEAIGTAVAQVKRMSGYCAGVVFFRWPALNETLAAQPDEALAAAGATRAVKKRSELRTVAGNCAAAHCADLYLENASPLTAEQIRYRIRSSSELSYFLPQERMPVRMSGPAQLEFVLPPYCGRSGIYLGRAVTEKPAAYTVEEER